MQYERAKQRKKVGLQKEITQNISVWWFEEDKKPVQIPGEGHKSKEGKHPGLK